MCEHELREVGAVREGVCEMSKMSKSKVLFCTFLSPFTLAFASLLTLNNFDVNRKRVNQLHGETDTNSGVTSNRLMIAQLDEERPIPMQLSILPVSQLLRTTLHPRFRTILVEDNSNTAIDELLEEKRTRKMISMNSHLHLIPVLLYLTELELQVQQLETDRERFLQIPLIITISILWFNLRICLDSKQLQGTVRSMPRECPWESTRI